MDAQNNLSDIAEDQSVVVVVVVERLGFGFDGERAGRRASGQTSGRASVTMSGRQAGGGGPTGGRSDRRAVGGRAVNDKHTNK